MIKSCTRTRAGSPVRRHVRPPFLKSPTSSLLLRIHGDGGLSSPLCPLHGLGDISKLRIPIWMLAAFPRLDVALQGVAEVVQQPGDDGVADRVAEGLQRSRQRPGTFAGPSQRRVRIAGRGGLDQRIEIAQQGHVDGGGGFSTTPWPAVAPRRQERVGFEFAQAALNRRPRNPGGPLDLADAAVPERARFGRCPQPTRALGEHRRQCGMFCAERGQPHTSRYQAPRHSTSYINQLFPYSSLVRGCRQRLMDIAGCRDDVVARIQKRFDQRCANALRRSRHDRCLLR